ncbi:response regulator [Solemya velum gill symbiont]|uniref:Histidine kinase n=2 Tax=Solemya velum gill symbiont TaxID=2340 RepID=A0A0B0HCA6_SOVGS|nr:response regulator [Solemya velum gill symbiont]KHF26287.1 PAS domain S-box-containing protein [Solemya velum gill symbiont]OOY35992.1 histidine kinase [Solemya velum gill symbiont]OOY38832.1 histidine kinase [Solemya velum gill symbiont]OOY40236.1 histidine kinase [Solemya velum gill symbiont]OOY48639.1 histidine kinase [Solemya velum gill symbiont]
MPDHSNFTLLIVDDNAANLYSLRSLISSHLHAAVIEADSGKQAIEIASERDDIDLIVLDIQMPEMDGFEAATLLKMRKKTRDIPIIFLTAAFKTEEFQQRGYDLGAADYLLKPIDDNQLINKLSTYFRLIEKERNLNRVLEQKVAERTEQLHLANQHLEKILNTMGEALLVLNREGVVTRTNPAALEMLGYNEDELIGMSIGDIFEEESDEQAKAFLGTWLEALIRTGALSAIEAAFITSTEKRIPILFSRTAINDNAGEVEEIICIAKNMSGYHKL